MRPELFCIVIGFALGAVDASSKTPKNQRYVSTLHLPDLRTSYKKITPRHKAPINLRRSDTPRRKDTEYRQSVLFLRDGLDGELQKLATFHLHHSEAPTDLPQAYIDAVTAYEERLNEVYDLIDSENAIKDLVDVVYAVLTKDLQHNDQEVVKAYHELFIKRGFSTPAIPASLKQLEAFKLQPIPEELKELDDNWKKYVTSPRKESEGNWSSFPEMHIQPSEHSSLGANQGSYYYVSPKSVPKRKPSIGELNRLPPLGEAAAAASVGKSKEQAKTPDVKAEQENDYWLHLRYNLEGL